MCNLEYPRKALNLQEGGRGYCSEQAPWFPQVKASSTFLIHLWAPSIQPPGPSKPPGQLRHTNSCFLVIPRPGFKPKGKNVWKTGHGHGNPLYSHTSATLSSQSSSQVTCPFSDSFSRAYNGLTWAVHVL